MATAGETPINRTKESHAAVLVSDDQIAERLKAHGVLDPTDDALKRTGGLLWRSAYAELAAIAKAFISVDAGRLMLTGLGKYEELIDAGRRTLGTGERVAVNFSGRELKLTQCPTVDVYWFERKVTAIKFELRTEMHLDQLVGTVRDGRLVELHSGACTVKVTLFYQDVEMLQAPPRVIDPGIVVPLGSGVDLTGGEVN